jgi:bifunctional non-homologous end joining protein LigD
MSSKLRDYRQKRDFSMTPEPAGDGEPLSGEGWRFVVQKHDASTLHYDLRLEYEGVLKSWAVPKEPLMEVGLRRLAVQTEDHPLEYLTFEGEIPAPGYGAGSMVIWDEGTWEPSDDHPARAIAMGRLDFTLHGEKLTGRWSLVRIGNKKLKTARKDNWLLIKRNDAKYAAKESPRPREALDLSSLSGMTQASSFGDIGFQLASVTETVPQGDDWIHEPKLDGYRLFCLIDHGNATLITRNGHDWTDRFPHVAEAAARLPCTFALLDGEAVVLDSAGISSFQRLQNAVRTRDPSIVYVVFDVLFFDGWDVRGASLVNRKRVARSIVGGSQKGVIRFGDHVAGNGQAFLDEACKMGLEGIICKRAGDSYEPGRVSSWLKAKCVQRQEFVVIGCTKPEGRRQGFGALLVGTRDEIGEPLRYAGRVGTGYDQETLLSVRKMLDAIEIESPPVEGEVPGIGIREATWVKPELVAEVEFTGWTDSGVLRHPSFRGLRDDKPAEMVVKEQQMTAKPKSSKAASKRVRLTNPDKILWPDVQVSKQDLAGYWKTIASDALPYMEYRPLSLLRCPEGIDGECFYQKHAGAGVPDIVPRVDVEEEGDPYAMVDSVQSLIGLTQIGVIEIHTWGSKADHLDQPDQITFDLDPAEGLPWSRVVEAAEEVKGKVEALGLVPFAKLTGGKGVHVVVPVEPGPTWPAVKKFARALAEELAASQPDRYTASMSKAKRVDKVFVDYLRNDRQATAIAPYSPRARPGATVALPIEWDQLAPEGSGPPNVSLREVPDLIKARKRNPWQAFESSRRSLLG